MIFMLESEHTELLVSGDFMTIVRCGVPVTWTVVTGAQTTRVYFLVQLLSNVSLHGMSSSLV